MINPATIPRCLGNLEIIEKLQNHLIINYILVEAMKVEKSIIFRFCEGICFLIFFYNLDSTLNWIKIVLNFKFKRAKDSKRV